MNKKCMKRNTTFSLRARSRSFKYAFEGFLKFIMAEHNAWLHLIATAGVVSISIILSISTGEAIALTLSIGFVWIAEMFNTAIEKIMDFISEKNDKRIKLIKDISAAAVLSAAMIALIVGSIIFIPKILI